MKLSITWNDVAVREQLGDLEANLIDPRPALESMRQILIASFQQNFLAEGRPETWADLAPSTIKRRRNEDKGSIKILSDTGRLRQSLTEGGTADSISEFESYGVTVGTSVFYASFHQEGTSNMPARPFAVVQDQDIEDMRATLEDFYLRQGPFSDS